MPNKKDQRALVWLTLGILVTGLIYTTIQTTSIDDGMELNIVNKSPEQKELAKNLLKVEKDAIVDPATGYVICGGKQKYVRHEPVVQITMCGTYVTGKKSDISRLKAANDYCMTTKKVCIKVNGSLRSNLHSLGIATKRSKKWFKFWRSLAAGKACASSHNMGQAFDILNFKEAHECLEKEGFWGGFGGLKRDPWHYYTPGMDVAPKLSGWALRKRISYNKVWCLTRKDC